MNIIIKNIYKKNEWSTFYPDIIEDYFDDYWNAVELMNEHPIKAEKIFKKIISKCGDNHIDAILHLGLLYNQIGKRIEGNALIIKAYHIVQQIIPNELYTKKDKLSWLELSNRPILRTIHAYGLELMNQKKYLEAIKEFEFIIKVNPNDNQGVRYLIIECLFHLEKYIDILKLNSKYKDDRSPEFLYGVFLVLYILDRKDEALIQYKKAKKHFPFVAEELIKSKHVFPKTDDPFLIKQEGYGYPFGSKQEAYEYWERNQLFWNKADGIVELMKNKR